MKLLKAALILGILAVLTSNTLAQTDWDVASALSLQDVASANLIYECMDCMSEETLGSNVGASLYACNKNEENCVLTISEKRGDAPRKIGTLKFSNAKAYFVNKKLFYLQAAKANKNGLPYDINGIMIPYVSSGDKIDFVSASPGRSISSHPPNANELVINENYFNNFYYDVGDYNQVREQLLRNPYQAESEMDTESGYNLKRGYWRPISLCGQEYFDAVTDFQSFSINGRNLDARRWSWFFVRADINNPNGCAVKTYQLSTNEDLVYKGDVQYYFHQYFCGDSLYTINSASATNLECHADTGEFIRNEVGNLLRCPVESGTEKLACQKDSHVSMQVGATIYNIRYDAIYSDVDDAIVAGQEIPTKLVLKTKVEDYAAGTGSQLITVKGRDSVVAVTALPSPCEESEQGCYSIEISSGKKAGLPSNDISFVEFGEAEGVIEISDAEQGTLQRRYVLHNSDKTARYRLTFNNNELLEISNLNKPSATGTRVEGHVIKGIRMVSHLATLRGNLPSRLSFNEHIDLYPLQNNQDEASVNRPYFTYIVRRGGERLYDIAARFQGISTIQELPNPSNFGASTPHFIMREGDTSLTESYREVIEYAREIALFNNRRNNAEWSQSVFTSGIGVSENDELVPPATFNPGLFAGTEVFIPLSAMSYLHPSRRNRVTVYSNPAESYQSITQRQQQATAEVFSDIESLDLATPPQSAEQRETQEWNRLLIVLSGGVRTTEPNSNEVFSTQRAASEREVREIGQLPTTGQAITGMQISRLPRENILVRNGQVLVRCQDDVDHGWEPEMKGSTSQYTKIFSDDGSGSYSEGIDNSEDGCVGLILTEYYCIGYRKAEFAFLCSRSPYGACSDGACIRSRQTLQRISEKGGEANAKLTPREQRTERTLNAQLGLLEMTDSQLTILENIPCKDHIRCTNVRNGGQINAWCGGDKKCHSWDDPIGGINPISNE